MSQTLARALLSADAVGHDALARAMLTSARDGTSLVRALLATSAIEPSRLEAHLARGHALHVTDLTAALGLAQGLPSGLCERLVALPVARDATTGTVDVAVVDADDVHAIEEMAFWLNAPVRMVHASLAAMEAALRELASPPAGGMRAQATAGGAPPGSLQAPLTPRYGGAAWAPPEGPQWGGPAEFATRKEAETARERDAILGDLLANARPIARRMAIFAVRQDGIGGWLGSPELGPTVNLRGLRWPSGVTTVLHAALAAHGVIRRLVPGDAVHAPLLAALRSPPNLEVALAPISVEGDAVAIALAADLSAAPGASDRLLELTRDAGASLERMLRGRQAG